MQVTRLIEPTRQAVAALRGSAPDSTGRARIAFVPTMGALHEGHLDLIRRGRERADRVVVSIFVNPTQFAPHEDFDRYPRPLEDDLAKCEREGVALVFNPAAETLYPPREVPVHVDVPELSGMLEGADRPHFFGGVCRVVAKLFNIVQPDIAVFGQKDYQQLRVIEAMVAGLCLPIHIEPVPTRRESDGLALSSRNAYLNAEERRSALSLNKALREAEAMIAAGHTEPETIEHAMRLMMETHEVAVDYAVVRDARTLQPVDLINPAVEPVVCLVAGRVDSVRLIDNLLPSANAGREA